MAGRCLGELVRKMGDRVLQQIIPILQQGMQVGQASVRAVCWAEQLGNHSFTCRGSLLAAYSTIHRGLQACSCPLA